MRRILAIDAGGTSTRAVVVDVTGRCHGYGAAGAGNPVSAGIEAAITALTSAARQAMAGGSGTESISATLVAMAGGGAETARQQLREGISTLGVPGPITLEGDLLAMYHSGTAEPRGYVLVAGTGSVAARIERGRLVQVADGTGWLLGDAGSGYWIGHQVARAVVAALDGRGAPTDLTDLLLGSLSLDAAAAGVDGRPRVLSDLLETLYGLRPIELARFAPLAFHAREDPVAESILSGAADALGATLATVRRAPLARPVVVGGSVAVSLLTAASPASSSFRAALGDQRIPVRDGLVGAAVLGLRQADVMVDDEVFARIKSTLKEPGQAVPVAAAGTWGHDEGAR
ncbi:MAG TPA: BadF/BadG/BcrA/BcrD ATPase family protein [Propionibacteriaceae bacterium]|nr:BadF/BadG/BcrA/BcrD ATPase family protein [Propionibacteriaceae bacterium]